MSLRRRNELLSDEPLSAHERATIVFMLIGAITGLVTTDWVGMLLGGLAGYILFGALVAIATRIASFLDGRRF